MRPDHETHHATPPGPEVVHAAPGSSGGVEQDWVLVQDIHIPPPSYWPAVLAFGITFLAWGIETSLLISAVGLVVFIIALWGWIGELRHEH